jgi:hypothetical protein
MLGFHFVKEFFIYRMIVVMSFIVNVCSLGVISL